MMSARRVVVVFDPASPTQSGVARIVEQHCPPHFSFAAKPARRDVALPRRGIAGAEFVLLLDTTRAGEMRALMGRSPSSHLVVVFADEWPAGLQGFHDCHVEADLVLIDDERLWRRLGCLPRTCFLPIGVDDRIFGSWLPPGQRDRRVLWLLPPPADYPSTYEPWIPSPAQFLEGSGFEAMASLPAGASAQERAGLFNQAAVVVCTSDAPASRGMLLEASACGGAIVTTRRANPAGIVRDRITGVVAESGRDGMLAAIRTAFEHRSLFAGNAAQSAAAQGWSGFGRRVYEAMESLDGDRVEARARPDLTADVTVFVSTVGAPSVRSCLDHLSQQDCAFRLEVIENVAPMSAALQRMLDACRTPFYVQVDEDMLLHPDAIRRLHAELCGAPAEVALVVAYLHDVHLEAPVQGVKIFRHAVARRYPIADVRSSEIDQIDRMRADGFTYTVMRSDDEGDPQDEPRFPYRVLGLHGSAYSPRAAYERFRTLELARRKHRRRLKHQEAWAAMLVERFLERRDPLDFYALMGLLAGAASPAEVPDREKDFRTYSSLPGFGPAMAFMREAAGVAATSHAPRASTPVAAGGRRKR